MSRQRKKSGIPDRWLDYKAVGKRLDGTRFIAFKVPLKQALNCQLSCSDVFGPWELLDTLNRKKQELGLIIDLTFTTRYYKLQDIPDSLQCVKILTAGHEIPSDKTILSFKRAVRRFLQDNADNDQLIGVHCTHGLNRTGYLICRYLIDVDGMDPKEAVELFNSSRGHSIERQNYLEDLRCGPKRSNDGMDEYEQEPMRGEATQRPTESEREGGGRDARRPHSSDTRHHRSLPPRGTDHRSHHHHHHHHHNHDPYPHNGLLPRPPLLPPSPVGPPPGAPFHHPYRWTPPHRDSQWRRSPPSEKGRSRYPPAWPKWSPSSVYQQDDRWRAPPPPPHHSHHHQRRHPPRPAAPAPPLLPRYVQRWTNESQQ